jgi:hypothetical protein
MKRLEGLQRPRAQARLLLCVGLFALPVGALTWLIAPGFMEPMFMNPGSHDFRGPIFLLGIVGLVIGELLMYRVYRTYAVDFEPDQGPWRYRDF